MPPIVSFIGWHDSGKTTLASQVVGQLKEKGYRVAVIKSSEHTGVIFDTPGTDTDKHRQAGADSVVFVAPDQLVLMPHNAGLPLLTLAHRYFSDVDIVIGEGFKQASHVAKIEVIRESKDILRGKVRGVIATATDKDISGDYIFRLDESKEIADFIEKRFLNEEKKQTDQTELLINGVRVPLKDWVQEALAGTVSGFVNSLKRNDEVQEIELRIRLKTDKRLP